MEVYDIKVLTLSNIEQPLFVGVVMMETCYYLYIIYYLMCQRSFLLSRINKREWYFYLHIPKKQKYFYEVKVSTII